MEKRTLEQIEAEIEATKAELHNVHGSETEVYARIVGYYRAVKHWNNGKRDEFYQRKMFTERPLPLKTARNTILQKVNLHRQKKAIMQKIISAKWIQIS